MDENKLPTRVKPETRTPVQPRAREKRKKILDAAFELFSERGYDAVGMRDVAAEAGVSIGTVYAYFVDKKRTFIEVFTLYSAELERSFFNQIDRNLPDDLDMEVFIHGVITRYFEIVNSRRKLHRDCVIMSFLDDEVGSIYAELERRGEEAVVGAFFGRFRDRIDVVDTLAAQFVVHKAIDEIVQYLLFYDVPIDRDRVFRETARMIARYLEKRG
jgi:AcrR family transcriptional regulator